MFNLHRNMFLSCIQPSENFIVNVLLFCLIELTPSPHFNFDFLSARNLCISSWIDNAAFDELNKMAFGLSIVFWCYFAVDRRIRLVWLNWRRKRIREIQQTFEFPIYMKMLFNSRPWRIYQIPYVHCVRKMENGKCKTLKLQSTSLWSFI